MSLEAGQKIPFGGSSWVEVSAELAAAFRPGDHVVVVQDTGDLLHLPQEVVAITAQAVETAKAGFVGLQAVTAEAISGFYESFARRLADDHIFAAIAKANGVDVESAHRRGRSTTRLVLDDKMRRSMIEALMMWRDTADTRHRVVDFIEHGGGVNESSSPWAVKEIHAPLGVVGFVFEGRPNVFADATGVLRSGNSVVFRIGSDALGTAQAMMEQALIPSLIEHGLPVGSVVLLNSSERSAGYALFSHRGLALAVARGSGTAVAQLGAVARQSGIPVSLHGTGGAWMLVAPSVDTSRLADCVDASLDRKVCNTLNVCCLPSGRDDILDAVLQGARRAGERRGVVVLIHSIGSVATELIQKRIRETEMSAVITVVSDNDDDILAKEWEWEDQPEFSLRFVDDWQDGIELFNRWSPQFIVAVLTGDSADVDVVFDRANAPFVGDGFTRWVDGQYALQRPELGLSNWQTGRLFARGGILSGDGVYSVRYLAHHEDSKQRR